MSQNDVDALMENCWKLYREVPRVTLTSDVHAAGFAYGDLTLSVYRNGEVIPFPVVVSKDFLKELGVHLHVVGTAEASVEVVGDTVRIGPGTGCVFTYTTAPDYLNVPPGAVWPVAKNYEGLSLFLDRGEVSLAEMLLTPMLPMDLLSTERAKNLDGLKIWTCFRITAQR